MTEKRIAIVIDADGKAGIDAFDATTGAAVGLGEAMDDLNGKAKRSGDEADKTGRKWEDAGKKLGLFVAAAAIGFTALVGQQIKVADETGKLATKLGVTTEFISEMGYAAKATGANAKILETGLFALSESAVKAEAGARRPAAAFKALGVDVLDTHGKLKSLDALLPELADKFEKMQDGPKEAALATVFFSGAAKDLLPLLNQGVDGVEALRAKCRELGLTIHEDTATAAAGFTDQLGLFKAQAVGLATVIGAALLPSLTRVVGAVGTWVDSAGGATTIVQELAGATRVLLDVSKAAGVYLGVYYVASLVAAAAASLSLTTITTSLTAAMVGVRTVAATLFGPVGLIAAGATALYLLATRQTEAEKAADDHKRALDALSLSAHGSVEALAYEAEQLKRNTQLRLEDAKAAFEQARAKAAADASLAQSLAAHGATDRGDMAGIRAGLSAEKALQAKALIDELDQEIKAIDRKIADARAEAGVKVGFDRVSLPGWDPDTSNVFNPKAGNKAKTDDDADRQAEAMRKYREEADRLEAELAGPLKVAEVEHSQRIQKLTDDLAKHNIDQETFNRLKAAADQQLAKTTRELVAQSDILGQIHADYAEEIRLAGLSNEQRRVEEELIRRVNEAKKAGLSSADIEARKEAWRTEIEISERAIAAAQDQVRSAEDVQNAWVGAATSATRAFGDFFANGLRGGKDFVRSLKDIFKRMVSDLVTMFLDNSLVRPMQNWLQQLASSGSSSGFVSQQNGNAGANVLGNMFQTGMDKLLGGIGKLFGFGGPAQQAVQAGTGTAMDGWFSQLKSSGGLFGMTGGSSGGYAAGGQSAGAGFGGMSPWMGAIGGAAMGWGMGGDTPGKIAGGLAGGVAGYGLAVGGSAALAASAAGATLAGSAAAGLAAIPVVGWIALAAFAVNAISGGKLFGTKAKVDSGAQQFSISDSGGSGFNSTTTVRQQSFFRGRKWETATTALDAEGQKAIQDLFDALSRTVTQAAQALGVEIPDLVGGTFRREFDAAGNLTKEFGTIAGRVYNEAQDAFATRLVGENLLSVAKVPGGAAEIEQLASGYRSSGDTLQAFATFMLAVQSDIKNAQQLWTQTGDGVLTMITEKIAGLASAGESLAEAYGRVSQVARQYGDLIGGVKFQIATHGLNDYQRAQVDVELGYRSMVKQANELAKSLGLSGARSEDLAAIEQLRALQMADLQTQYQQQIDDQRSQFLANLGLSDLSPMRDDQKLTEAMQMLRDAAASGDWNTAQQRAQQVLGLGRNMYASGEDYNTLYSQVVDLLNGITVADGQQTGFDDTELTRIADLLESQPQAIATALFELLGTQPASPTPVAPTPTQPLPPTSGDNYGGTIPTTSPNLDILVDGIRRVADNTAELLDLQRSRELQVSYNA